MGPIELIFWAAMAIAGILVASLLILGIVVGLSLLAYPIIRGLEKLGLKHER